MYAIAAFHRLETIVENAQSIEKISVEKRLDFGETTSPWKIERLIRMLSW